MSKKLGWTIKILSWGLIYFVFSMSFNGSMPLWAYFIVVFLCIFVEGIVDRRIKKDETEDESEAPKGQGAARSEETKSGEGPDAESIDNGK